jgi:hypothetical protein
MFGPGLKLSDLETTRSSTGSEFLTQKPRGVENMRLFIGEKSKARGFHILAGCLKTFLI